MLTNADQPQTIFQSYMSSLVCPAIPSWPELMYAFLIINGLGFILTIICLIIIQVPANRTKAFQHLYVDDNDDVADEDNDGGHCQGLPTTNLVVTRLVGLLLVITLVHTIINRCQA